MKPETLGLVLGGVLPAFLFAIDGVSSKAAARTGMSWAPFMIATGLTIALAGAVALYFDEERRFTSGGVGFAVLKGAVWALGSILVVVALSRFGAPLAKPSPPVRCRMISVSSAFSLVSVFMEF